MTQYSYLGTIQVTSPNGRDDEDVITADFNLTTRRPFSETEIRTEAVAIIAARTNRITAGLEIERCNYTVMPAERAL
ncbi:hypothetical protein [Streptomyces gardneri]|uniref:hypothetical protein n=1 Tax=Streptomyces gardneri TaxID=66892 RepID=UPI0035DE6D87